MIGQHETAHSMVHGHVGTLFRQSYLNTCRAPWNESGKSSLPDSEKTFMNIGWIHIALNHIQDRDVTTLLARYCRHHSIFGLQKSPHDIQNSGFPDSFGLLNIVGGERRVGSHEEVASRSWNQGSNNANEIIVHIARIS